MTGDSDRDQSVDRLLKAELRRGASGSFPPATPACVDAETFAAWSEGTLPAQQSSAIESHVADCARCQALVAAFARTESAAAAVAPARSAWSLRWLPLAAGTAAAVTLVVWLARPSTPPAPPPTQMAKLEQQPATAAPPATPPAQFNEAARADRAAESDKDKKAQIAPKAERSELKDRLQTNAAAQPRPAPTPLPIAEPTTAAGRQVPLTSPPAPTPPKAQAGAASDQRASTATGLPQSTVTLPTRDTFRAGVQPETVVAEFSSADLQTMTQTVAPVGAAGAGGGGARGGGGGRGGSRTAGAAGAVDAASVAPTRWRVLASGAVERSRNAGSTWEPVTIDPPARITNGAAVSPAVCWLVGRDGVILRTQDGEHFTRLSSPERVDLFSVRATSALAATVTTTDGRTFTTIDGGLTWK